MFSKEVFIVSLEMLMKLLGKGHNVWLLFIYFKDWFIWERESMSGGQGHSPLSREPNVGLHPKLQI